MNVSLSAHDATRFPVTTQKGLTPKQQLMIDAFNHDQLMTFLEEGGTPDAKQEAIREEFRAQMPHNARLAKELAEQNHETLRKVAEDVQPIRAYEEQRHQGRPPRTPDEYRLSRLD